MYTYFFYYKWRINLISYNCEFFGVVKLNNLFYALFCTILGSSDLNFKLTRRIIKKCLVLNLARIDQSV